MTLLNYVMEVTFECGPADADVGAFTEAASIIGGYDTIEEFLACGLWPLSEKFGDEGDPPVEDSGADASSYSFYWGTRAGVNFRGENSDCRMFACRQL
jgi:hypothetical protein